MLNILPTSILETCTKNRSCKVAAPKQKRGCLKLQIWLFYQQKERKKKDRKTQFLSK